MNQHCATWILTTDSQDLNRVGTSGRSIRLSMISQTVHSRVSLRGGELNGGT